MRLIDADALAENWFFTNDTGAQVVELCEINGAPTIDPESLRPVAHWEYNPNGMDFGLGAWECSRCKAKNDNLGGSKRINPYMFSGSKYCPNCGAKMLNEVQNDA